MLERAATVAHGAGMEGTKPTATHTKMQPTENRPSVGDTVKYSTPGPGEEAFRFILREDNGNRVLIELVCDMPIRPVECVAPSQICRA